jgi:hypothetical protein
MGLQPECLDRRVPLDGPQCSPIEAEEPDPGTLAHSPSQSLDRPKKCTSPTADGTHTELAQREARTPARPTLPQPVTPLTEKVHKSHRRLPHRARPAVTHATRSTALFGQSLDCLQSTSLPGTAGPGRMPSYAGTCPRTRAFALHRGTSSRCHRPNTCPQVSHLTEVSHNTRTDATVRRQVNRGSPKTAVSHKSLADAIA